MEPEPNNDRTDLIKLALNLASDPEAAYDETRSLARRMLESMGPNPSTKALALAAIEYLGCTFSWRDDAERAVDAFGLLLCNVATLAALNGMAIDPLVTLAIQMRIRGDVSPLSSSGMLAAAVRESSTSKEHKLDVVEAIAMVIAQGLDNVEIMHDLDVQPVGLFKVMARRVLGIEQDTALMAAPITSVQGVATPATIISQMQDGSGVRAAPLVSDLTAGQMLEIDTAARAKRAAQDPDRAERVADAFDDLRRGVDQVQETILNKLVDAECEKIDQAKFNAAIHEQLADKVERWREKNAAGIAADKVERWREKNAAGIAADKVERWREKNAAGIAAIDAMSAQRGDVEACPTPIPQEDTKPIKADPPSRSGRNFPPPRPRK